MSNSELGPGLRDRLQLPLCLGAGGEGCCLYGGSYSQCIRCGNSHVEYGVEQLPRVHCPQSHTCTMVSSAMHTSWQLCRVFVAACLWQCLLQGILMSLGEHISPVACCHHSANTRHHITFQTCSSEMYHYRAYHDRYSGHIPSTTYYQNQKHQLTHLSTRDQTS